MSESLKDTISCSAAAYGDLERLRGFVEQGGAAAAAALREPDGNGYHALQWAALNNYPHVALYIIEVGLGLGFPSVLTPILLPRRLRICAYPFLRLVLTSPYSFADDGIVRFAAARGRRECDGPREADGAALGGGAWVHFRGRRADGARRQGRGRRRQWLPGNVAPVFLDVQFEFIYFVAPMFVIGLVPDW